MLASMTASLLVLKCSKGQWGVCRHVGAGSLTHVSSTLNGENGSRGAFCRAGSCYSITINYEQKYLLVIKLSANGN